LLSDYRTASDLEAGLQSIGSLHPLRPSGLRKIEQTTRRTPPQPYFSSLKKRPGAKACPKTW